MIEVCWGKFSSTNMRVGMNIHEQTELDDNESIKTAKKTLAAQNGGCCGGGAGLVQ